MELWNQLNGTVEISVTSAEPDGFMRRIADQGIPIHATAVLDDPLVRRFQIGRHHWKLVKNIAQRRGDQVEVIAVSGLYWRVKGLLARPVLILGLAFLLLLSMFLPTRILFFRVEGNTSVSTQEILEVLADCGVDFCASRKAIRSEKIKNVLLEKLPQLQWAGINTAGCVATVSVRERQAVHSTENISGVTSIVASRDGVICEYTVLRGNGLCKVGQAVKAGQVLISGYTDCGISIRATRAEGEIYARTQHTVTAVTPAQWLVRGEDASVEKKFAVIIGKKRINFYKGSGISDSSCGKMYTVNYLSLPGGFQLPLALVVEEVYHYPADEAVLAEERASNLLVHYAREYLQEHMVAGQILSCEERLISADGVIQMKGIYACQEMIGQIRNEEIMK